MACYVLLPTTCAWLHLVAFCLERTATIASLRRPLGLSLAWISIVRSVWWYIGVWIAWSGRCVTVARKAIIGLPGHGSLRHGRVRRWSCWWWIGGRSIRPRSKSRTRWWIIYRGHHISSVFVRVYIGIVLRAAARRWRTVVMLR